MAENAAVDLPALEPPRQIEKLSLKRRRTQTLETNLTRRELLLGSTVLAASFSVIPLTGSQAQGRTSFSTPLAIPPSDVGSVNADVRVFDLSLQNGQTEFFEGLLTDTSGINGSYLGPVLRMRSGETVQFRVANNLGHPSTLHWHGMNVPASADGGPHQIIEPGETWSPEFMVQEVASTMWFHSHQLHGTASQVWAGLAGMIIIDDDNSDELDLPKEYGIDDIPVILQDRRFERDGAMPYDISMHDEMAGLIGNIPVINGTVAPYFSVTTEKLRVRLLNGANASIYHLEFSDQRPFVQIASDGGLLGKPAPMSTLRLAPGERAEIIVDFVAGDSVTLRSDAATARSGMGRGMGSGMMGEQTPQFELIEFRANEELSSSPSIPEELSILPVVSENDAIRTRRFELEMPGMGPMRMLGLGGGFTINGATMDMQRIDEIVRVGEAEIWEIVNTGPMIHPFHIHNTQFRILDRDGQAPMTNETGLKDTVVVHPKETVRVLVRFDNYTDENRPYMYHCHILEHEDAGMMGQFIVV